MRVLPPVIQDGEEDEILKLHSLRKYILKMFL